jgi:hypothetical protein
MSQGGTWSRNLQAGLGQCPRQYIEHSSFCGGVFQRIVSCVSIIAHSLVRLLLQAAAVAACEKVGGGKVGS